MLLAQMQRSPLLTWIQHSDYSLPLLVMSAAIALLGLILCIRPHRLGSIVLAVVAFLPGLISFGLVVSAAARYSNLASSPRPPSPTAMAEVIGLAFSSGSIGLLATMIPMLFVIVALVRSTPTNRDLPEQNDPS